MTRNSQSLEVSLSLLDEFLSTLTTPFLSGTDLSHLDCEVLPKLHHLRVAASILRGKDNNGMWKLLLMELFGFCYGAPTTALFVKILESTEWCLRSVKIRWCAPTTATTWQLSEACFRCRCCGFRTSVYSYAHHPPLSASFMIRSRKFECDIIKEGCYLVKTFKSCISGLWFCLK